MPKFVFGHTTISTASCDGPENGVCYGILDVKAVATLVFISKGLPVTSSKQCFNKKNICCFKVDIDGVKTI